MSLRIGQKIELSIQSLISNGYGLARHDGLAVFVADALPGQQVEATVTATKARFAEARLETILAEAPDTRPTLCSHSDQCGGCAWQSMQYSQQIVWKQRFVSDALRRIGRVAEPPVLPILPSPSEWGYRNKMTFAFAGQGENLSLGLRRRASHGLVDVTGCLLQTGRTMQVVETVRREARRSGLAAWNREKGGWWRFLVIREPMAGGCLVELITFPHPDAARYAQNVAKAVFANCPEMSGFVLSERKAPEDIAHGTRIRLSLYPGLDRNPRAAELDEDLGGLRLRLGAGAFFQVNTPAAIRLYDEAARLAAMEPVRRLWDLYCGVGSIGLYLARNLEPLPDLYGIEQSIRAVMLARNNAASLQLQATYAQGDVGHLLNRRAKVQGEIPDLVVVDPPRAGLEPRVTAALCRLQPERILYVSCNPATLARDTARLAPYRLEAVQPVDFFPQTPHVESMSLFVRNGKA